MCHPISPTKIAPFIWARSVLYVVGDPMGNPIVVIWNNPSPQKTLLPHDVDCQTIAQCLGRPLAPPQKAAPMVHAVSHSYTAKSPLVTMGRLTLAPSRGPIPKPNYLSYPWCLPSWTTSISKQPFCHNARDRHTHTHTHTHMYRQTDGWRKCSITMGYITSHGYDRSRPPKAIQSDYAA